MILNRSISESPFIREWLESDTDNKFKNCCLKRPVKLNLTEDAVIPRGQGEDQSKVKKVKLGDAFCNSWLPSTKKTDVFATQLLVKFMEKAIFEAYYYADFRDMGLVCLENMKKLAEKHQLADISRYVANTITTINNNINKSEESDFDPNTSYPNIIKL